MSDAISWTDFEKVDLRVGTILEVKDFPKAKKPAVTGFADENGDIILTSVDKKLPNGSKLS